MLELLKELCRLDGVSGEEDRVPTPVRTASGAAKPCSFLSIRGRAWRRVSVT